MMNESQLTRPQAIALAAWLNLIRNDWGELGISKALWDARHMGTAAEVGIAATRAAAVLANRTPAVIALPGAHWQPPTPLVPATAMPPRPDPTVAAAEAQRACANPAPFVEQCRNALHANPYRKLAQ